MSHIVVLIGRIMIAALFIIAGIGKVSDPAGAQAMMESAGVPASYALPVGIFEIAAGLLLALGVFTRITALALAAFCIMTIFLAHTEFSDPVQAAMALKNLAIAGGLLCLFAAAHMAYGYDMMRSRRKGELASRGAEHRAHEAELRAARAEGRLESTGRTAVDTDGDGVPDTGKKKWF